eukprot:CAMPEP_0176490626 /NCGR_PEP_ID=MMETSP0200_2-20121128/7974_1 /TAXON_ID=947934 /ORGANISM="Chaetoceros sp., Strain GSL56" /LENGTH=792 /DNA_ID=CAMNT_0017887951 /DNA_START=648 /DNA_END=3026 /DNA_ORIENTATION=+
MLRHMKLKTKRHTTSTRYPQIAEYQHHQEEDSSTINTSTISIAPPLVLQEESIVLHPSKVSVSSCLSSSSSSSTSTSSSSSSCSVCSTEEELLQTGRISTVAPSSFLSFQQNKKQQEQQNHHSFVPTLQVSNTGNSSSSSNTAESHIFMPPLPRQVCINKPLVGRVPSTSSSTNKSITMTDGETSSCCTRPIIESYGTTGKGQTIYYHVNNKDKEKQATVSSLRQEREKQTKKRKISIDSITALQRDALQQYLPIDGTSAHDIPMVVSVLPQQYDPKTSPTSFKKPKLLEIVPNPQTAPTLSQNIHSKDDKDQSSSNTTSHLLLSRKQDPDHLNPIHCFVRQNIEVFVASEEDIAAPCPGRKNTIKAGQVGLRCIHCRNVESRQRAKRAVCYPSTIGRVYNCVSDMKFDHFSLCKYLPASQRALFNRLRNQKESQTRGKSGNNTSKYYYDTAVEMGMRETFDGVVILDKGSTLPAAHKHHQDDINSQPFSSPMRPRTVSNLSISSTNSNQRHVNRFNAANSCHAMLFSPKQTLSTTSSGDVSSNASMIAIMPKFSDRRLLATPSDAQYLNPVHCFVRKNVEVFIANEKDVAAPAPGRKKPIMLGQVGIRCIHCQNLPPKYRVKRAICYPPTIASLYHAVSNMKFDHYGACKGLTPQERQSFSDLKAASSRKIGAGGNTSHRNSASLARYYQQSARSELGLYDTEHGIRVMNNSFLQDSMTTNAISSNRTSSLKISLYSSIPHLPPSSATGTGAAAENSFAQASSLSPTNRANPIMDGMSALMLAASDSRFGR